MIDIPLSQARYSGDAELLEAIQQDDDLAVQFSVSAYEKFRRTVRKTLLADAVRVEPRLLPKLDASFCAVKERTGFEAELEAYVFADPNIQAYVAPGHRHTYFAVSSGAINILSDEELEFVIGHELGHAIFGHIDFEAIGLLASEGMDSRGQMQVLAWSRAAEISADRCGLVSCGSIDVAASAMFRLLSGLNSPDLVIGPDAFTGQWDHLMDEMVEAGGDDQWQMLHPFPSLRMKAMMLFWNSDSPLIQRTTEPVSTVEEADKEVQRLLATMDPLSRERGDIADPILAEFLLWGGLYTACANGRIMKSEIRKLEQIAPEPLVKAAVDAGGVSKTHCLMKFQEAIGRRHERLKALEINRILQGMLQIAWVDGEIDEHETEAIRELAELLGIDANACSLVRDRFLEEMQGH